MAERYVLATELSNLLGLSKTTLNTHLGKFSKYLKESGGRYYYLYNYYFLRDLKKYYEKRMKNSTIINSVRYFKTVSRIQTLMDEMK